MVWLLTHFEHLHHRYFVKFKVALDRNLSDFNNICYKNTEPFLSLAMSS